MMTDCCAMPRSLICSQSKHVDQGCWLTEEMEAKISCRDERIVEHRWPGK